MTIYIKSEENGWEVERQIDLPDDEKLVRSIMRSIKNRMASPKAAGGGIEPKAPEDKPEEIQSNPLVIEAYLGKGIPEDEDD